MCLLGTTSILMSDGSKKQIKDIKREDHVITNIETKEYKKVVQVTTSVHDGFLIRIPKDLLGNTTDIIMTGGHPIWVNDDQNRVYSKNINGVTEVTMKDTFYNLQFEEESVYYAESLKIDSLSPNFRDNKLPKSLYFNKLKHDKRCYIETEDDRRRNKPLMIRFYPMTAEMNQNKPKYIDIQNMVIQGSKGPTIVPMRGGYGAVLRKKRA